MNIYTQNTTRLWVWQPIIKAMHATKMLHSKATSPHTHILFSLSFLLIYQALLAQQFYRLSPEGTPPKDETTPSFVIVDSK